MGRCAWFDCCRRDVELGLSENGEPEGNDNEAFSHEWFDENFVLSDTQREAEQLRLQQLQIEQEIQELEQAQEQLPCFYFREIPDKPPPPYTPPDQTSRNCAASTVGVAHRENAENSHFIPSSAKELTSLTLEVTNYLHNVLACSGDLEQVEAPPEFYEDNAFTHLSDIRQCSRRIFKKLVFDLIRDIVKEVYSWESERPCAPWEWSAFSHKRRKSPPKSKEMLQEMVQKQVITFFGYTPKTYKERIEIRWSRKKRDYVDEILMKESRERESTWNNYDEDEVIVKNEITLGILDSLIGETVQIVSNIRKAKLKNVYDLINIF
ncbi:centrosome-associated protein 350-like [Periplaneta americana]|uniref:centrosome-associated protein 350-like n=1 Tax=Periplaneta americana TaxID=6978 RepID=UPI0037E8263C